MSDFNTAQSSGFSPASRRQNDIKVIAVTAGKGGVGKTNVCVNLACAMAKFNKKVLLLDADLSLANVDVLLGLKTVKTIENVVRGECDLKDIIVKGPYDIDIIPGSSGSSLLAGMNFRDHSGLITAFDELHENYDFMFVDTPAGVSSNVAAFLRASQEIIVVVCDEPTSITDAYALMKVMSQDFKVRRFHLLANMVQTVGEGRELYQRLSKVSNDYLDVTIDYLGCVPFDNDLKKAVKQQRSIYDMFPGSTAANSFKKIAREIRGWRCDRSIDHTSPFFIEKLLERDAAGE